MRNLTIPVTLATGAIVAFILWVITARLMGELTLALQVVIYAGAGAGVTLAIAGAVFGIGILNEKRQQAIEETQQKRERTKQARLQTDEHQIKIVMQSRHFHNAGPSDQVYMFDGMNGVTYPMHLSPGPVNGRRYEPTEQDIENYRLHRLTTGARAASLPSPDQPAQLAAGPEPLLPVLLQAQRLIIGGGSDSGKSTLAKHLIAGRADNSQIVVIDPHSPSKVLGFDVIGAGRDYAAIGQALESLELLMHERYGDVAQGLMGYFQHSRVSVFIDEWTGIIEAIPEAGNRLKTLLTESRKVNMFLCLLTHSTTLDGLGLPSAQLKKSAMIVELVGGQGQPHRAFVHPSASLAGDGRKARPVEYALPGPFTGWPAARDEVTLELPSPEIIKVQKMSDEGASLRSMARELFPGVKDPGGPYIDQVKELLKRAEAAKKARIGRE